MVKLDTNYIKSELTGVMGEIREFYGKYLMGKPPIVGAIKCYKDYMRESNDLEGAVYGAVASQAPVLVMVGIGLLTYLYFQ